MVVWLAKCESLVSREAVFGVRERYAHEVWMSIDRFSMLTASFVRSHLPPRLRVFRWLLAPQK